MQRSKTDEGVHRAHDRGRDLQTVYDTLAKPKLYLICGQASPVRMINNIFCQADIEVTCADPAARFCSPEGLDPQKFDCACKADFHASCFLQIRSLSRSAQDDTMGDARPPSAQDDP